MFKLVHVMRQLLASGCSVDGIYPPHYIGNPLARALRSGCKEAVQLLCDYGANFNLRSHQGSKSTALVHAAKHHPSSDLVSDLLDKYNSDANLIDNYGHTIVSLSILHCSMLCFVMLMI
jgi:ankyrin repeat protein